MRAEPIDVAGAETTAAVEELEAAVEQSTADGTVTQDEAVQVEVSLANSEELAAYAEQLALAYADVYGEYAGESLETLESIEEDLDTIAQNTTTITGILEQGSEAATAAATQLEEAASTAGASASAALEQAESWTTVLDQLRRQREQDALAVKPTEVPSDPAGAVAGTRSYFDAVKSALADGRISSSELTGLTQASANAVAGLQAQGGQMAAFSAKLSDLTTQLARGELPQAKMTLPSLEGSMPSLEGSLPSPPAIGGKKK